MTVHCPTAPCELPRPCFTHTCTIRVCVCVCPALQTLRSLKEQVRGIGRFVVLVSRFDRQQYTIPGNKRLRQGWRNLRESIRIDHPDAQAQVIIENKLMDEVGQFPAVSQLVVQIGDDVNSSSVAAAHAGLGQCRLVPACVSLVVWETDPGFCWVSHSNPMSSRGPCDLSQCHAHLCYICRHILRWWWCMRRRRSAVTPSTVGMQVQPPTRLCTPQATASQRAATAPSQPPAGP